MYKVLFIGLGSIGRRHLRLLKELTSIKAIHLQSGQGNSFYQDDTTNELHTVDTLDQALAQKPDFAVISVPTVHHVPFSTALARAGIPFLLEKPVSHNLDGVDELNLLVQQNKVPVTIGFQMRHHPAFKKLLAVIAAGDIGRPISLHGHVGQYLPDWRPEIDYRQTYSARKNMGGGVIFDICHEIDIALQIMGPANRITCMTGTYSDLEIDTEDIAEITLEHRQGGISSIHLNYVERGYHWQTGIIGTRGNLQWNYAGQYLQIQTADDREIRVPDPPDFHRDDLFRAQLKAWLKVLSDKVEPTATLEQGIEVTRICCCALQSAAEGRHIRL